MHIHSSVYGHYFSIHFYYYYSRHICVFYYLNYLLSLLLFLLSLLEAPNTKTNSLWCANTLGNKALSILILICFLAGTTWNGRSGGEEVESSGEETGTSKLGKHTGTYQQGLVQVCER